MKITIEKITPQMAAEYLERNTENRAVRKWWVKSLATSMTSGQFRLTHQGIAFNKSGVLIDGQHRLMAVIESGVSSDFVVFRGVDDSAFTVLDSGVKRNMRDRAGVAPNVSEPCLMALNILTRYTSSAKHTPDDEFAILNGEFGQLAQELHDHVPRRVRHFGNRGIRAAAIYQMMLHPEDKGWVITLYDKLCRNDLTELPRSASLLCSQFLSGTLGAAGGSAETDMFVKASIVFDKRKADIGILKTTQAMRTRVTRDFRDIILARHDLPTFRGATVTDGE